MWSQAENSITIGKTYTTLAEIFPKLGGRTTTNYFQKKMKVLQPTIIEEYFIDSINVKIVEEFGYFICSDPITNMFGTGDTIEEAINNYREVLLEFYEFLAGKSTNQFDKQYRKAYKYLQEIITKRR